MPQQIVMDITRQSSKTDRTKQRVTRRRSSAPSARVSPKISPKIISGDVGILKIIPLGGLEEVGRNLNVFEYVPKVGKSEILVVDMGLGFPVIGEMPGIDFVLPNIEYLTENKDKIVGIIITHGHYDHIGAIPYFLDKIGNPQIYAAPLTRGLIIKRQEDFPHAPKPQIIEFNKDDRNVLQIGSFIIEHFHVNHSIPDSVGYFIKTPVGNIMYTGDFKIDFTPVFDKPANLSRIVELAGRGVKLLMIDSTNAFEPGHAISEKKIMENLEEIIRHSTGRIIASTFASLLERIQQLIYIAGLYGRKVAIEGRSMKTNVEVIRKLGYLQVAKGVIIKAEEALKLPDNEVLVICTGAQAEDSSVLTRIAHREHKYFSIIPGDTLVFSSSIIPGNERAVQGLKDVLIKQGAKVITSKIMDIHSSGHARADDVRLFMNLVKPEYVMPIHGNYFMLKAVEEIALELEYSKDKILIAQNGDVIEMNPEKIVITNNKVPANLVYVDGIGIGDIGEVVIRDRQTLSKDGMFVVIVTIDSQTGAIRTSPDIISRGFVYLRESRELLRDVRNLIRRIIERNVKFLGEEAPIIQEEQIRYHLKEEIAEFLFKVTQRRPVVIPVVIKV
ncbi:MAG: ribonuclease J [Patescibacteria group bacterium]